MTNEQKTEQLTEDKANQQPCITSKGANPDGEIGPEEAAVVRRMSEALKQQYFAFRDVLAMKDLSIGKHHYALAEIVIEIMNRAIYEDEAVENLAEAVKLDPSTLYKWAKLPPCWPLPELLAIHARPRKSKLGIQTHLEEIAEAVSNGRIADKAARDHLVDRLLHEGLSLDQLAAALKGADQGPPAPKKKTSSPKAATITNPPGESAPKQVEVSEEAGVTAAVTSAVNEDVEPVADQGEVRNASPISSGSDHKVANSTSVALREVDSMSASAASILGRTDHWASVLDNLRSGKLTHNESVNAALAKADEQFRKVELEVKTLRRNLQATRTHLQAAQDTSGGDSRIATTAAGAEVADE